MVLAQSVALKRVFFDRIFQRSYWIWRRNPAIIVPTMLGSGLSAIIQSIVTLAAILVLTNLALNDTLFDFLRLFRDAGPIQAIFDPSVFPVMVPVAMVAGAFLIIALVLGSGFVLSAEYATYLEAWQTNKVSFGSIIRNGSKTWKEMAWTFLLSSLITWAPVILGLVLILLTLPSSASSQGFGALIGAFYILIFGLAATLVLSIFTLYSYPAVVVSKLSGLSAIRQSFRAAGHNLGITITYGVVSVVFQLLSILIILFAGLIGLPLSSLATTVLSLLLTPVLHSTKTMIYYHAEPSIPEMTFAVEDPIWRDLGRRLPRAAWEKVRMGLSELARFTISPRNMPFHLLSVLAFAGGLLWGMFVSYNGVRRFFLDDPNFQPGRLNPLLSQVFPPALGIDLFFHNWLVSIGAALAGLGFAGPSFEIILFNGFVIGIIAPLIPTLTMFLAVIAPHGIIEIPSFLLAGSLGIKLGYAAIKTKTRRGPDSIDYLSSTLRQAVYIVIGLAPLFLVAGLIEADLTPFIARMFGWI